MVDARKTLGFDHQRYYEGMMNNSENISGWWLSPTPLKNMSQLGS